MTQIATADKKFSLVPQNLHEATILADKYAKSGMVPKTYINNPAAILVAWEFGASLGFGLMQSLQGITVISGNPCLFGDAALALVMSSGELEEIDESIEGQCTVKRKGMKPATTKFSMADATKAGLTNKPGPWKDYPKRMLQMRNRAFALRDNFADILKGMKVAEEVQDYKSPYPNAIDTSANKSTNSTIQNINDAIEAPDEALLNNETTEFIELVKQIKILRHEKDEKLKTNLSIDALNKIDDAIENGFENKTLDEIRLSLDFLINY